MTKSMLVPLLALAAVSASAADAPKLAMPGYDEPAREWKSVDDALPKDGEDSQAACRDTIRKTREERGLPKLQRETARPDEPFLIAAVDHRIDDCSVMVMKHDTSDIRPLPANPDGPAMLTPARQ